MKTYYIDNFENCFINELDEKIFVDLDLAKKNYNIITKTSKASRVCLALAGTCFSGAVITFFAPKIVVGFASAFLLTLPAGIALNGIARHKFIHLKDDGELQDYVNYDIYAKNEFIKNRVVEIRGGNNAEVRTQYMLKNNLSNLITLNENFNSELEGLEDYYLDRFENMDETGEKYSDIKKEKELYMGQIVTTTKNIKKHINQNAKLYKTFVPEFSEKISEL